MVPSTFEEMRAQARALRDELGTAQEEAIDVDAAARALGCRVLERRDPAPHLQAALVPATEHGFVVWILKREDDPYEPSSPKDRFLILHELAHTYFYSRGLRPHRRFAPPREHEEFLCDVFAAEALVPRDGALRDIGRIVAAYCAPAAVASWVRLGGFNVDQWRKFIDGCTGPDW